MRYITGYMHVLCWGVIFTKLSDLSGEKSFVYLNKSVQCIVTVAWYASHGLIPFGLGHVWSECGL